MSLYTRIKRAAGSNLDGFSKEQAEDLMENARNILLKVSNMSSFSKYLESDMFWSGVLHSFEMGIGLI